VTTVTTNLSWTQGVVFFTRQDNNLSQPLTLKIRTLKWEFPLYPNNKISPSTSSQDLANLSHPDRRASSCCSLASWILYVLPSGSSSLISSGIPSLTLFANFFGMICRNNQMRTLCYLWDKTVAVKAIKSMYKINLSHQIKISFFQNRI
jgi:hypothetical protein